jgi:hypothetical protein
MLASAETYFPPRAGSRFHFSNPDWTNQPGRFYLARAQQALLPTNQMENQ